MDVVDLQRRRSVDLNHVSKLSKGASRLLVNLSAAKTGEGSLLS